MPVGGRTEIKRGEALVMGELRDAHLILDRAHPPLNNSGTEQLPYRGNLLPLQPGWPHIFNGGLALEYHSIAEDHFYYQGVFAFACERGVHPIARRRLEIQDHVRWLSILFAFAAKNARGGG